MAPGAYEGWHSLAKPGSTFDSRVAAGSALGALFYDATKSARDISCPLLVCVSERETLIKLALVEKVIRDAPRASSRRYDADHFEVYSPPLLDKIVADQIAFLREHLTCDSLPA